MDIKAIILTILAKKGQVKTRDIVDITGFSGVYINRFLQELRDEGNIVLIGKANKAHYVAADPDILLRAKAALVDVYRVLHNKNLEEHIVLEEIKKNTGIFLNISEQIAQTVSYAFSEMLNNAIEHSQSPVITIEMKKDTDHIHFKVIDKGIGIFKNIIQKKQLQNELEAIQDLEKGKLTTAPQAHSGEGIFFTSKIADIMIIQSGSKQLMFNNLLDDVFVKDIKNTLGTKVSFSLALHSSKNISDIFAQYTDDSFQFSKTKVTVKLSALGAEYISRSQARRIVSGLDKFKTVVLNFKGIHFVGQGFADEIFRVWKKSFPHITIIPEHANDTIQCMIKRAGEEQ